MSLLQHTLKVNLVAAAKGSRCFATGMSDGWLFNETNMEFRIMRSQLKSKHWYQLQLNPIR
jgi:hypothetical protein